MAATLLHLSDLHLGRSVARARRAMILVDRLIADYGASDDKPWVILTGDVVNDGRESQYVLAGALLDRLRAAGFSLFLVPGNHDYGHKGNLAKSNRLTLFKQYLLRSVESPEYPICERAPGWALVGLDSMQDECGFWDGLFADGELGGRQLEALRGHVERLQPERRLGLRVVLCLHHHPFPYPDDGIGKRIFERAVHALKDGDALMEIIDGNVDAILYGHEHRHVDVRRAFLGAPVAPGIPVVLSCGSSTARDTPVGWLIRSDGEQVAVDPLPW